MRKMLLTMVGLLLLAAPAAAQEYVTNGTQFACSRRSDAELFVSMAVARDTMAMAKLVTDDRCVLLRAGISVSVVERGGITSGLVKIRPKGETDTMWAPREAVDRVKPATAATPKKK